MLDKGHRGTPLNRYAVIGGALRRVLVERFPRAVASREQRESLHYAIGVPSRRAFNLGLTLQGDGDMKNRLVAAGFIALWAWPTLSMARVWAGADVGLTSGALAATSPIGVYAGLSTRSFPVGLEVGFQALSINPSDVNLLMATALYRAPIAQVAGMHFLARAGVANINSSAGAFVGSSTRPIIGAGVSYRVLKQVNVRAEYDLILNARVASGPHENAGELLIGATYHFG